MVAEQMYESTVDPLLSNVCVHRGPRSDRSLRSIRCHSADTNPRRMASDREQMQSQSRNIVAMEVGVYMKNLDTGLTTREVEVATIRNAGVYGGSGSEKSKIPPKY